MGKPGNCRLAEQMFEGKDQKYLPAANIPKIISLLKIICYARDQKIRRRE
jgi:hypothetical protein